MIIWSWSIALIIMLPSIWFFLHPKQRLCLLHWNKLCADRRVQQRIIPVNKPKIMTSRTKQAILNRGCWVATTCVSWQLPSWSSNQTSLKLYKTSYTISWSRCFSFSSDIVGKNRLVDYGLGHSIVATGSTNRHKSTGCSTRGPLHPALTTRNPTSPETHGGPLGQVRHDVSNINIWTVYQLCCRRWVTQWAKRIYMNQ